MFSQQATEKRRDDGPMQGAPEQARKRTACVACAATGQQPLGGSLRRRVTRRRRCYAEANVHEVHEDSENEVSTQANVSEANVKRSGRSQHRAAAIHRSRFLLEIAVQPVLHLLRRPQHCARLVFGFLPFGFRHRIGDDAGRRLHVQHAVFQHAGANRNRQIHFAAE